MISKNIRVLVVEDEDIYLSEMLNILESYGITDVECANNYENAREIIDKQKINIALVDIFIKGEQSGLSFGRFVREHHDIPLIYVSSNLDARILDIAKETHPDAIISKPIDPHTLYCNIMVSVHNRITDSNKISILDDRIFIKKDGVYEKLFLDEITVVESDHVYNFLYVKSGSRIMIRGRLKDFYEKFPNYFIQINRGCAINIYYVDHFDRHTITVHNKVLEVGKKYRSNVYSRLIAF